MHPKDHEDPNFNPAGDELQHESPKPIVGFILLILGIIGTGLGFATANTTAMLAGAMLIGAGFILR